MNAICHPHLAAISGTQIGATTAPMLVPELKMPTASARSLFGNHSATVLIDAGKFAASPTPSRKRTKPKVIALRAKAVPIAASDHQATAMPSPSFVPIRSRIFPQTSIITAYDAWKAMTMRP